MCGIAGFCGAGTLQDLEAMAQVLTHRGPDGANNWFDPERAVGLGHRRLSIVDLADGSQPMWTSDAQLGVTFNGEIYNHRELRADLQSRGHRFITDHSDTEVLLHGYREWGEALPEKLNGMWAFAIYDRKANQLFLSRDRFGQKPLFYAESAGCFAFASELNALEQHSSLTFTQSVAGLQKYFAYGYIPAPHTLYREVRKLPGGYNLTVDLESRTVRTSQYWEYILDPFTEISHKPEPAWCEELRHLLGQAVERRMMSDVPLGVFLSGGVDSSAIAHYAQAASSTAVHSFSIGFEEASFDESEYARQVAEHVGCTHRSDILHMGNASGLAPKIASRLDEPMGDSSIVPTYLLCGNAREAVTVALGGDGADELFAGYDPFKALRPARLYDRMMPGKGHELLRTVMAALPVSHTNMSLDFKIKRTLRGLSYPRNLWNAVWLGPLGPVEIGELFDKPLPLTELYAEAIAHWDACPQEHLVDKTLQFYTKLYLQDDILVKVDRASMMHSLEVRAPFLDIDLVNFIRRIPHAWKYRNGETKYLLKRALEPVLPHDILYRAKHGFGMPIARWLRDGALIVDPANSFGMRQDFVQRQVSEHLAHNADNRAFLWNMWVLQNRRR
jgi:asparagine synthase (glutamine-hydrolysing)